MFVTVCEMRTRGNFLLSGYRSLANGRLDLCANICAIYANANVNVLSTTVRDVFVFLVKFAHITI